VLENFQLAAIIKGQPTPTLLRIPLHQHLQTTLASTWDTQYTTFVQDKTETSFSAGYTPEDSELVFINDYVPPAWLRDQSSKTVHLLDPIPKGNDAFDQVIGIAGFALMDTAEVILLQNFSRSHIIRPNWSLFLDGNTYNTLTTPGITLSDRLTAVYTPVTKRLLFSNFRNTNYLLPLSDYYAEASDQQIHEILSHSHFVIADIRTYTKDSSQWFRKRFAMLHDSKLLDNYSVHDIAKDSHKYDVNIQIEHNKIVFPTNKTDAKKLLQYLNEEIYLGAITNHLYETNSKRTAD